jgi:hypothetical protein
MALRTTFIYLLMSGLAVACAAQKCKGMDVNYENTIQYPTAARASRLQGDVVVQIHIATDGTLKADVVSGPPVLAESAKRFAETWSITWPGDKPATACDPTLHVSYKLKDHFNVKMRLPSHIVVEAPPIETNEPPSH